MAVNEPVTMDFGVQKTVVFVDFIVTVRPYVPVDGAFLESPP
jgi:hypothetical protein